jgi:hypothetical protein
MPFKQIAVSTSVTTQNIEKQISPRGVVPARSFGAIRITITNRSIYSLRWVNVTLALYHEASLDRRPTDGFDGYQWSRRGYEPSEVLVGTLKSSEAKSVTHIPHSKYDPGASLYNWQCYRIYGETSEGHKFEQWIKSPVALGVVETSRHYKSACFIATAAYQDPDHPMVQQLRFVLDEILSRSRPGRGFTAWYYRNGPRLASVVRPRPALRLTARAILTPIARSVQASRRMAGFWRKASGPKL